MKINSNQEAGSEKLGARRTYLLTSNFNLLTSSRRSGIALIITLILLSVTLVMALAFLAISRRESSSVTTAGDTATARLAADSALANAEAQAMANVLSTTNPYNFGLLVSTNYINPNGFALGFNNVNYDYTAAAGNPRLSPTEFLENLTNLWYSPRPPVFVPSPQGNYASPLSYDFRFYLDLNRNGKFDTNGVVGNFDSGNNLLGTSLQVGDPEWIGVLAHPDQPYGPNNPFVSRFCFFALPVGNSLDLNAIHNQVFDENNAVATVNPADGNLSGEDFFFRNQGVGSWEINLAAFLADLNTNQWDNNLSGGSYLYNEPANYNSGSAFDDARALLTYRYNNNYSSLYPVGGPTGLFTNSTTTFPPFQNDIDFYSDGPLQTNTPGINASGQLVNLPWAGADNINHFFDLTADLFDPTKTSGSSAILGFTNRLLNAGTGVSTYDRYTFYRLLSQLGTDTSPETGKMNLNYRNITNGVIVPGMETNFYAWTPLEFFTNAADRMLRAYTANWISQNYGVFTNTFGASTTQPFGIAKIPVYVSGQFVYTPAVHRILQLAANIYDATVNNSANGSPDYPDVFRPLFSRDAGGTGTNVYITGFTNVVSFTDGATDIQLSQPFDVSTISSVSGVVSNVAENIYGVPWIIGAKKGFPNFNEFSMENNLGVTRRLQLTRTTNSSTPVITSTNQMYTMSLISQLGIELWNSYAAAYPGTIIIGVNSTNTMTITNDDPGFDSHPGIAQPVSFSTNNFSNPYVITSWPGAAPWSGGSPNPASFVIATFTGPTLTNSVYRSPGATPADMPSGLVPPSLIPTNYFPIASPPLSLLFESNSPNGFHFPQFGVVMTNRLQVFMLDFTNGVYRVIDYVHFAGPDSPYNVNQYLADNDNNNPNGYVGVWDTNYLGYPPGGPPPPNSVPPYGIVNQIAYSKNNGPPTTEDGLWQADPEAVPSGGTIAQQQSFFRAFFKPGNHDGTTTNLQLSVNTPYAPTRYIVQYVTWQANDPLVHYLTNDISAPSPNNTTTPKQGVQQTSASAQTIAPLTGLNLGSLNDRFSPWGGNPVLAAEGQAMQFDTNAYNLSERDPLVASSDNWDFPTNKFPTVGWLGRVHRGTPWQTVYLKSSNVLSSVNGIKTWAAWTGDSLISSNQYFDAANSTPTNDWQLFDLFTTAVNDNATRGQLSVNVAAGSADPAAGLAAWSALFSGIALPPVSPTNTYSVIAPVGSQAITNSSLGILITNINYTRANFVNPDGVKGSFENIGDILAASQLSDQSPFLNLANTNYNSDEMYEWLPQQTMSLLRVGAAPRYVIYSYGQTLKPAPNGTYLNSTPSGMFGMVTNYQVVSEIATRAVVRFKPVLVTNSLVPLLVQTNYSATIESYNILPPE
jgi:hypothetical protein